MALKPPHGRTYSWNAFETKLEGPVQPNDVSIAVASTANLRAPGYLVIDPETSDNREFIYFGKIVGDVLEDVERIQNGTNVVAEGVTHASGTIVRAVAMEQMWDDLWHSHIEAIAATETMYHDHIDDVLDPHVAAGYITAKHVSDHYLPLDGAIPMAGPLRLSSAALPAADEGAAPKKAVVDGDATTLTDAKAYADGKDHNHDGPIATHNAAAGAHGGPFLTLHAIADKAKILSTARNITVKLTGDATGSKAVAFDGSKAIEISIPVVVDPAGHTHAAAQVPFIQGSKGGSSREGSHDNWGSSSWVSVHKFTVAKPPGATKWDVVVRADGQLATLNHSVATTAGVQISSRIVIDGTAGGSNLSPRIANGDHYQPISSSSKANLTKASISVEIQYKMTYPDGANAGQKFGAIRFVEADYTAHRTA